MITKLRLKGFKSFEDAELSLGPFTVLVGTNASGKSNIRDAFRFLNGVARGYTVPEVLGGKWGQGGVLQWRGIRGGTQDVSFNEGGEFKLDVTLMLPQLEEPEVTYGIGIAIDEQSSHRLLAESLTPFFSFPADAGKLDNKPLLSTLADTASVIRTLTESGMQTSADPKFALLCARVEERRDSLLEMRFFDLSPEALRQSSLPGQITLGDRGENLSSVLQAICEDDKQKASLLQWLQELTPLDAVDFEFPADLEGKISVTLVEGNGRKTSVFSASDGTLRFLGLLAALLGPEPAGFYFMEEIENGIHPNRLYLLLELIQQRVAEGDIQIVATTHSPLVLTLLHEEVREHAAVTYRLPGHPETRVKRVMDIPHAREIFARQDPGHLHASGWMENSLLFDEPEPVEETPA
jgi:predicted ATPase